MSVHQLISTHQFVSLPDTWVLMQQTITHNLGLIHANTHVMELADDGTSVSLVLFAVSSFKSFTTYSSFLCAYELIDGFEWDTKESWSSLGKIIASIEQATWSHRLGWHIVQVLRAHPWTLSQSDSAFATNVTVNALWPRSSYQLASEFQPLNSQLTFVRFWPPR